ncbi:unnamed protein product [Diplocarpon coronariae]
MQTGAARDRSRARLAPRNRPLHLFARCFGTNNEASDWKKPKSQLHMYLIRDGIDTTHPSPGTEIHSSSAKKSATKILIRLFCSHSRSVSPTRHRSGQYCETIPQSWVLEIRPNVKLDLTLQPTLCKLAPGLGDVAYSTRPQTEAAVKSWMCCISS